MSLRRSGAACAAALLLLLPASASADVSGAEIVSLLNAQRAAHGIPAGIVEDTAMSAGCAKHNAYGAATGVLEHREDPSHPAYSEDGNRAAQSSVLYQGGGPWSATTNPFETAPIHLHQLFAPRIDSLGAAENGGWGCASTLSSRNRPAPPADVVYTYPGDGTTGWPAAQVANESPYTPGEKAGIPAGARTGPYLYVMVDGPLIQPWDDATASAATLTGPDGPVDVVRVDNTTPGLEGYLPTGMEIIPRSPLRENTTYTASVAGTVPPKYRQGPVQSFARTWSFTTGGTPEITIPARVRRGKPIALEVRAGTAYTAAVTVKAGRRTLKRAQRTFPAGTTSTFRVGLSRSSTRRKRSVRVAVTVTAGATVRTVTRTVRLT